MNKHLEYIAGKKTTEDWKIIRQQLIDSGANAGLWSMVVNEYYQKRLDDRYLKPIKTLQLYGKLQGEGFSIVTIQCSLIEFLESTIQGKNYRYVRKGETLGTYEYSSSQKVFVDFLTSRFPFSNEFKPDLATDFYINVRCGLLHEARTKNGWRIKAKCPTTIIVNPNDKIVFRDNFQAALIEFIETYKPDLLGRPDYKEAFIRKFDSLCQ